MKYIAERRDLTSERASESPERKPDNSWGAMGEGASTCRVLVESGVADMGQYGDEGYEPSADELIDVLKNLENLAAANPELYRAIVEQIKGRKGAGGQRNNLNSMDFQQGSFP